MTRANLFKTIATMGLLGTIIYKVLTNARSVYIQIIQASILVTLWLVLVIDRYRHTRSKLYLKWDLFLVSVATLLIITIISFFR
ncbi:hypothetical protein LES9216_01568 [Leuconostoc suionicum]|uniref:Uncharacterized protein n=1 Tax=Leuconostoc suionicum TaxID=1511761 RepID=A0A2N9KEZ1_9LACO|nr:hypothetical protein A6B45_09200 [Leuconostoc suionicum]MCT4401861.1 hypothetical protein [Leuconostoc suionicum]SPD93757.1 hypothetical protein LES8486_01421 [Leuconostoc suionicum]SPE09413.1 hypothetical protein LES9216_01568 [Leuconostoc suionicum]SPH04680.1 hypothetical protein LES8484_01421 [Leuconostoc suionicum]